MQSFAYSSSGAAAFGRAVLAGVASCLVLASSANASSPGVIAGPARVVDGDTLVRGSLMQRVVACGVSARTTAIARNNTPCPLPLRPPPPAPVQVINGERIRLYGVDAPESAQQCKDAKGAPYACGLVSKDALDKKIGKAPVTCQVGLCARGHCQEWMGAA